MNDDIYKIVLTGGPCGGKSTAINALKNEFGDKLLFLPEVPTILLSGGFPVPGKDLAYSDQWQYAFQSAVNSTQNSLEKAFELIAKEKGIKVLVCDRGFLDGAAYMPGGIEEFYKLYNVDENAASQRYNTVIHLESVATANPELYGKTGNDIRYEPLDVAQAIEHRTREAWKSHPNWQFIEGGPGIKAVTDAVISIIKPLVS